MSTHESDMPELPQENNGPTPEEIISSLHGRPSDEGFADWASGNPDGEYRLWLMTRSDSTDLASEASRRLRSAERLPFYVKAQVVLGSMVTAVFAGSGAFVVIEKQPAPAIVLGIMGVAAANGTRQILKNRLLEARNMAAKERQNFESFFGIK